MSAWELVAAALLVAGCGFYLAGTVGLLRFPDALCRLHALTKADNLGLMLVCASMAMLARSWQAAFLLGVVWLLGLLASTVSAHLVARRAAHGSVDESVDESGDVGGEGRGGRGGRR